SGTGDFALVGLAVPNSTLYVDTTVSPSTSYTYQVRAANDCYASACTNTVDVTTVEAPPAAPTGLKVIGFSYNKVSLAWSDNSSNETAFEVYRKTGSGAYALVGLMAPNTTFFQDTTVSPETTYTYQVRAANNHSASTYSNSANVTTVEAPPAAPTGLTAAAVSSTQINLTWVDNSSNETVFEVYRQTGTGAYALAALLPAGSTSFSDKGMS